MTVDQSRAALIAATVVATDVNSRALSYARLNAALNGVSDRVEFRSGSTFDGLDTERFDLIVSDPPIIPTPPGSGFFIHSDGGVMGTSVSETILAEGVRYLRSPGMIQMLCTAFQDPTEVAHEVARHSGCQVQAVELYSAPLGLNELADEFQMVCGMENWEDELLRAGCRHLRYFYLTITQETADRQRVAQRPRVRGKTEGSWQARLQRLFLAYHPKMRGSAGAANTAKPVMPGALIEDERYRVGIV